jgi:hypothetical protein
VKTQEFKENQETSHIWKDSPKQKPTKKPRKHHTKCSPNPFKNANEYPEKSAATANTQFENATELLKNLLDPHMLWNNPRRGCICSCPSEAQVMGNNSFLL